MNELIIAHRGESFDAPENTLAAINLAWERQIKAVEIDIQLTMDNEIVVIHDYDTLRISGKKKKVADSSLNELKLLDAGSYKNKKWKSERIPTLSEVLSTVPEDARLIIEIKCDDKILGILKQELDQSGLKDFQIAIIAFNLNTLVKAKKLMPNYKVLWLLNLDYSRPWWLCWINEQKIINRIKQLRIDGINVWSGKILDKDFINKFRDAGLLVYTWTVNDPDNARMLIESGINGITTDRAEWMVNQLESEVGNKKT